MSIEMKDLNTEETQSRSLTAEALLVPMPRAEAVSPAGAEHTEEPTEEAIVTAIEEASQPISLIDLAEILDQHRQWVESGGEAGARAELNGVNLSKADLTGVNLQGASLQRANLSGADLSMTNLRGANL